MKLAAEKRNQVYPYVNMTHKNRFYTAPEAELLVIRFEENFLDSAGMGIDPITGDGDPLNVFGLQEILPNIF